MNVTLLKNHKLWIKALHLPKPNTNYLKRTLTYRGIQLWNSVIPLLQEFDGKSALKRNYRKYCKNVTLATSPTLCTLSKKLGQLIRAHNYFQPQYLDYFLGSKCYIVLFIIILLRIGLTKVSSALSELDIIMIMVL